MPAFRYTQCGLSNVVIEGAQFATDDVGESVVTIPNIAALHKVIATGLVAKRNALTGRELRFLRTEMGLTQAELAKTVHREPLAISRWERGEVAGLDENAEAVIRLLAKEMLNLDIEASVRDIAGWSTPGADSPPFRIDGTDPDNYRLLSAA